MFTKTGIYDKLTFDIKERGKKASLVDDKTF